jgi:hypothetical protein
MRTNEQIMADAADDHPFSNHSEYDMWAGSGTGCYDCLNDDEPTEKYCPILSAALLGKWPREWTRAAHRWEIGDKSGSYEVVDECTEFERRRDDGGDDPEPEPEPPPVVEGQVDMFEVFADQIAEHVESLVPILSKESR